MEPKDTKIFTIYTFSYCQGGFNVNAVEDAEFQLDLDGHMEQRPNDTALNEQVRTQLLQLTYHDWGEYKARKYAEKIMNNKNKTTMAFACSSGRWHSVALAVRISEILEEHGIKTTLVHNHIDAKYEMPQPITKKERAMERDMISIAYTGRCHSRFHVNTRIGVLMYELGHRPKGQDTYGSRYQTECGKIRHNKYLIAVLQNKELANEDTNYGEFHDNEPMKVRILHLPKFFVDHYYVRYLEHNNDWRDMEERIEINWTSFILNYVGICRLYGPVLQSRLQQIMKVTEESLKEQMIQEKTKEEVWSKFNFIFRDLHT